MCQAVSDHTLPESRVDLNSIKTFVAERFRVASAHRLPIGLRGNLVVDYDVDLMLQEAIVTFDSWILGKRHETMTRNIEWVPATWWDHFKDTYFPEWLRIRFPVRLLARYFEFPTQIINVCPHADVLWSKTPTTHIHFMEPKK